MKYVVYGHGRTGSHLVADVLRAVIEYQQHRSYKITDLEAWPYAPEGSVFHTNLTHVVPELTQSVAKDRIRLIVTKRWNVFATAISIFVASYTKEWSGYSDRVFEPIIIDPDLFYQQMRDTVSTYTTMLPRQPLDGFRDVTYIMFEDIAASPNKERWVADTMGLPYKGKGLIWANKNIRNYQQLITNYEDLDRRFNNADFINELWRSNDDFDRTHG